MIDLLVIAPPSRKLYQALAPAGISAVEPNIWAGLLASSAKSKGHSVVLLDLEAIEYKDHEILNLIDDLKARVVLFVVTGQNPNASTAAMDGAVHIAELLHNNIRSKIAFVGPHINALYEDVLIKHKEIDIAFTNEGVYALNNVLSSNLSDSDLLGIKGIAFRGNDKIIRINQPEVLVPQEKLHIDLPGVAYDMMPSLSKYRTSNWHANFTEDRSPFASIYTSLGCIFKCSFCMINIINRTDNNNKKASSDFNVFRYWDPKFTIQQLDYLAACGVKNLKVADEMWVLKPEHFMNLCDLIIERDYKFNIWAYTRVNTVKEQYLEKLKKAGVNWLAIGIEAGNQNIRQEITKGKFSDVNIRDVIGMIQSYGINVVGNFIFGLGHDTYDTMNETLDLAQELLCENTNMYCATALPGSPLYLEAVKNKWELPTTYSGYGFLSYDHVPSRTYDLTAAEVLKFRDEAFTKVFSNPAYLSKIENKFGLESRLNIEKLVKIPLKRKLLGD